MNQQQYTVLVRFHDRTLVVCRTMDLVVMSVYFIGPAPRGSAFDADVLMQVNTRVFLNFWCTQVLCYYDSDLAGIRRRISGRHTVEVLCVTTRGTNTKLQHSMVLVKLLTFGVLLGCLGPWSLVLYSLIKR